MSLSEAIGKLNDDIGAGLNEASIRNQLTFLKEQAEAFEATLERSELNLKDCRAKLKRARSDLERLEADTQTKHIPSKEEALADVTVKLLQLFAREGGSLTLEHAAHELGLLQVVADHHPDLLIEKRLIELVALTPNGSRYALTPKGRAYVVENNIV